MTAAESSIYELRTLEGMLTSFIARAVGKKEDRLAVLESMNELDDIARTLLEGTIESAKSSMTGQKLETWLGEHQSWNEDNIVRPGDRYRVKMILAEVDDHLEKVSGQVPEISLLRDNVKAWLTSSPTTNPPSESSQKLVLRRHPETDIEAGNSNASAPAALDRDTLAQFTAHLAALSNLHNDLAGNRLHLISVLDEALQKAERQFHREALHLAAAIIYYLKLQGYLVEPFVTRLKTAERVIKTREEQQKPSSGSRERYASS